MALLLNYPARADTAIKRYAYAYRVKEHMRMLHNLIGLWFREGLTQDEYDNGVAGTRLSGLEARKFVLANRVKAAQPFKAQITVEEFRFLVDNHWEQRHQKANTDLGQLEEIIKADPDFDGDVGSDI